MDFIQYILYGILGVLVIITSIITIRKMVKKSKEKKEASSRQVEEVVEKDGVRYTPGEEIVDKEGNQNVTFVEKDIVLQPRKMVKVDKKGVIKPGKYTVLSAYENEDTFNIRIGLYVKEYKHGESIVLAEGEEICPTSSTIILR